MPMLRNATGKAITTAASSKTACTRANRGHRWECVPGPGPLTTTCSISSLMAMTFSPRDGVRVYGGDGDDGDQLSAISYRFMLSHDSRLVMPSQPDSRENPSHPGSRA